MADCCVVWKNEHPNLRAERQEKPFTAEFAKDCR
jgi:hypothetical protein